MENDEYDQILHIPPQHNVEKKSLFHSPNHARKNKSM